MSPKVSKGFQSTLSALNADHTWIVAPVPEPYPLKSGAQVTHIKAILKILQKNKF
jgi:hypothetical protein